MNKKTYTYTNLDGRKKMMIIYPIYENDFYFFEIWDAINGELCGNGKKHIDEIIKFLRNYNIKIEKEG